MNIVLIGFKGVGKTPIGAEIAKISGLTFLDVDPAIEDLYESETGKRIHYKEIYTQQGAEYFRSLETKALGQLCDSKNSLVATGGGAITTDQNREIIKQIGKVVYLSMEKNSLFEHLSQRKLSQIFDKENPRSSFDLLYDEREPLYRSIADFTIDVTGLSTQDAAQKVISEVGL